MSFNVWRAVAPIFCAASILSAASTAGGANPTGDANLDGAADMQDAVLLQKILFGAATSAEMSPLGLLDGNGTPELSDLMFVAQIANGIQSGVAPIAAPFLLAPLPNPGTYASEANPNPSIGFSVASAYSSATKVDGLGSLAWTIVEGGAVQTTLGASDATVSAGEANTILLPLNPGPGGEIVTVRLGVPLADSDGSAAGIIEADIPLWITPAICGDGLLSGSEQCDDGGTSPGDGCASDCSYENPLCGNGALDMLASLFGPPIVLPTDSIPSGLAADDFNGDGAPDIAVIARSGESLVSHLGDGAFGFIAQAPINLNPDPAHLSLSSINGDGLTDLVVLHPGNGSVSTMLGVGDGTFMPPLSIEHLIDYPVVGVAGDFDPIGGRDYAFIDAATDVVSAMRNLDCCGGLLAVNISYGAGGGSVDVRAHDLDGVAGDDLVVVNRDGNSVSLFPNLGGFNNFDVPTTLFLDTGVSQAPVMAALGEVDGDNDRLIDIVTADSAAPPLSGFSIFGLRRKGIWTGPVAVASEPSPQSITLLDINDDARLDILATHAGMTDRFAVYFGDGMGGFGPAEEILVGMEPSRIVGADFNNDGLVDLAVLHGATDAVSILPNHRLGERCDDGNRASGDGCDEYCQPEPPSGLCGDGLVNAVDEECDDGENGDEGDDCPAGCVAAFCGDGVLQTSGANIEECDSGWDNDNITPNACREDCSSPFCGDGVVDDLFGEECDDGGANNDATPYACRTNCLSPWCGDGVVDFEEECDDGNATPGDGCEPDCTIFVDAAVPDTGQYQCWDSGNNLVGCPADGSSLSRQDGGVIRAQPSYAALHADSVIDWNTGLIWQRFPSGTRRQFEAVSYCDGLVLDGFDDWRLPSLYELATIVDAGRTGGPYWNTTYFGGGTDRYWTTTSDPGAVTVNYFTIAFGSMDAYPFNEGNYEATRCVRGDPPPLRELNPVGPVVVDSASRLVWEPGHNGAPVNWWEAVDYCMNLELGGYADWRLPDVKEWESVIDHEGQNPAVNAINFPDSEYVFWSSTTRASSSGNARYFDVAGKGAQGQAVKSTGYRARCVRDLGAPVANNGVLDLGETCDDGGRCDDGTPCLNKTDCTAVGSYNCLPRDGDGCENNGTCTGGDCSTLCGDGSINAIGEACDDGNNIPFDGCDAACQIEPILPTQGLADTGQTKCYSAGASVPCVGPAFPLGGQDGFYPRSPQDFTVMGEVVVDNHTGLMWERSRAFTGTYRQFEARSNCAGLVKGGFDDWRMPTVTEGMSLLFWGKPDGPHVDASVFSGYPNGRVWTESVVTNNANSNRWILRLDNGWTEVRDWGNYERNICVRGPELNYGDYAGFGDTALDQGIGLLWTRTPFVDLDWTQALDACNALDLDGHDDWRLPDIRELSTAHDAERRNPTFNPLFFSDAVGTVWSSTTRESSDGSDAYFVNGANAQVYYASKSITAGTRAYCVRVDYLSEPGNGIVEASEECDDGNLVAGDGCEPDGTCTGGDCAGLCGDGVLNAKAEECDDANFIPYDGCSQNCLVEAFTPTALADTQQEYCYSLTGAAGCEGPEIAMGGQDGYHRHTPHDFTIDEANGIVIDNLTGLNWEESRTFTATYRHWEARSNCAGLLKGGFDDWRLPNLQEWWSISTFGFVYGGADHLVPDVFTGIPSSRFWAEDRVPSQTQSDKWIFRSDGAWTERRNWGNYENNLCVRGPELRFGDFLDLGEVIVDDATGLMWQRDPAVDLDWAASLDYCNALVLADRDDWRLPNIRELFSAADPETQVPAFDSAFLDGPSSNYWSSTTRIDSSDASQAYWFRASDGVLHWGAKTTNTAVATRCVRSDFLPFAGNGVLESMEECDDGRHCDDAAPCVVEADCLASGSANCLPRGGDGCDNNGMCTGGDCAELCGNGRVDSVDEECDDGGHLYGDGCDPACLFETIPSIVADTGLEDCSVDGATYPCLEPEEDWGGQDAFYRRTPQSLTVIGDVALDNLTGLMWEKSPFDTNVRQQWDADADCAGLVKGGFDDWRLPSILEMYSWADFSFRYSQGISLDTSIFSGFPSDRYWTSDRVADNLAGWRHAFHLDEAWTELRDRSNYERRVCVRGPKLEYGPWRVDRGVAIDDGTGMMWTREGATNLDWRGALAHCNDLIRAGHIDWRLPDVREMSTIYDPEERPLDADIFLQPTIKYWTSTTTDENGNQTRAFVLFPEDGRLTHDLKTQTLGYGAVCVRSDLHPQPGNGIVDVGEECDDGSICQGGAADGTDCTDDDRACLNGGGVCGPLDGDLCSDSGLCAGDDCVPLCGNGRVDAFIEECDDGNSIPYDGCSPTCLRDTDPSVLSDTGQTLCFDTGQAAPCLSPEEPAGGQDGFHQRRPFDFTAQGNVVVDNNTGLLWQRDDGGSNQQWGSASAYCASLTLDGFANWRLPTMRDLLSIVHYGKSNGRTIDDSFTGTNSAWYWTGSRHPADRMADYGRVFFDRGLADHATTNNYYYVRCVQGDPLEGPDWRPMGPVVIDARYGLMWEATGNPDSTDWTGALDACNALSLAGHDDWRLPDIRELAWLTDWDSLDPAIDASLFSGVTSGVHWSSTSSIKIGSGDSAYVVDFAATTLVELAKTLTANYRCVRSDWVGPRGNGVVEADEGCDDGNLADGDGCDANGTCTGGDCLPLCGDGVLDAAAEECDDGDTFALDGCDDQCRRAIIPSVLADTGQEICFDVDLPRSCEPPSAPGGGQDGWHKQTPPSFVNLGATIIDVNTGLMWERTPVTGSVQQRSAAANACFNSTTGGWSDWRLPTAQEWLTITDYTHDDRPAIDTGVFAAVKTGCHWSLTVDPLDASAHYYLQMSNGGLLRASNNTYCDLRCVRGAYGAGAPTLLHLSTVVKDANRALMWERYEDSAPKTWLQALDYCNALALAGYGDWRLPSVREAMSLSNLEFADPGLDAVAFPATDPAQVYWTSTTDPDGPGGSAMTIDWGDRSDIAPLAKVSTGLARCVRSDLFTLCGNGLVEGAEACDDGNLDPLDGCDPNCLCEGPDCLALCGNGALDAANEACDDGGLANFDGCDSTCFLEEVLSAVPDTGQSRCWDETKAVACPLAGSSYAGQDAQTEKRSLDFVDTGGGSWSEQATSLEWEAVPDPSAKTRTDAEAYCAALSLNGESDWRLPSVHEAMTLLSPDRTACPYAPDALAWPTCAGYWTTTPQADDTARGWVLRLDAGVLNTAPETDMNPGVCVRGAPLDYAGGYADLGTGVVDGGISWLLWEQVETVGLDWAGALAYCDSLVLAGVDDWRLPDLREAIAFIDFSLSGPATNPLFATGLDNLWTSTTRENVVSNAYIVNLTYGTPSFAAKGGLGSVRCVSGGLQYQ